MVTLIILIVLVGLGVFLSKNYDYEFLGICVIIFSGVWLLIHLVSWSLVSYGYEVFLIKRNAFEETLKVARESGNEYESAAIIKEISIWNIELAKYKYDNKTLYFDQYIDDRIELLEPIK